MHSVLSRHARLIFSLFAFYSILDGEVHTMSFHGFSTLWHKSRAVDSKLTAKRLRQAFDSALVPPLGAVPSLTRSFFLRALVLVAWAKYTGCPSKDGGEMGLAEGTEALLAECIARSSPSAARLEPDGFRKRRLYTAETHSVLVSHREKLQIVSRGQRMGMSGRGGVGLGELFGHMGEVELRWSEWKLVAGKT